MAKIAVTSYAGARKWLYKQVDNIDEFVDEIIIEQVNAGDQIYGILPVSQAAAICEKGAEYFHLSTTPAAAESSDFETFKLAHPKLEKFYINSFKQAALPQAWRNAITKLSCKFKASNIIKLRKVDFKLALYALLTAAGIATFADALTGVLLFQNQLTHWFGLDKAWFAKYYTIYWLVELMFGMSLFMWASWSLRKQAKNWIPIRDVKRQAQDKTYCGLVLSLSTGNRFELEAKTNTWYFIKEKYGEPIRIKLTGDLAQDIKLLEPLKIQWELILRILKSQHGEQHNQLKRVALLGSQDCSIKNREGVVERISAGTYPNIKNALAVLSIYPEFESIQFEPYPVPIPPNDIEAYYNAYLKIAHNWVQKHNLNEEDILIDITGGKSLNSVAAALATLHNKMQFHYVDTNNLNDVLVYKMEYRQQSIS